MATKVDLAGLRQEFALLRKDLELLSTTMTVRLGSMLVIGFGVMIAVLKFLQSGVCDHASDVLTLPEVAAGPRRLGLLLPGW